MYLGECAVIAVPAYLIGVVFFENIILKRVSGYYEYMNGSYGFFVYLVLFGVYFLVSLMILAGMIVYALRTDADLRVKGGFQ